MITFRGKQYNTNQGWGEFHPDYNYWFDPDGIKVSQDGNTVTLFITNNEKYDKLYGAGQLASVDSYLYGVFEWEYTLPIGKNIWPALWLTGRDNWPPEIDVMEGWTSGHGMHKYRTDYRRNLVFNDIQPRLHFGTVDNHMSHAKKVLGMNYTWRCLQKPYNFNSCKLLWTPDVIRVWYDNKEVYTCKDKEILSFYNEPMIVVMNNAVTGKFTSADLSTIKEPFTVYDFKFREV